jgi:asparagine synthase (glutamine-hydrolysing)
MCGIYGLFNRDRERPVDVGLLDRMEASLHHRGPDGGGRYTDGPFGMGMRRLSIIDLKTGDQPVPNENRSVWVVFNGEIYNYRELTTELMAKGHRFATASDTEVLVHLYEEYGDRCVDRLRGMFAFAIWDASRQSLFLARDRVGIKPLYYAAMPHSFVFGSELKALMQSDHLGRELSTASLAAYLQFGYVPDPLCILAGVAKLPPGHTLTIRAGEAGAPRPYWESTRLFEAALPGIGEAEAAEELWEQLRDAVRSHLVSDVPLGAFLSGGIDSSTVVAIMAHAMAVPVKTFSVGFREEPFNELPYARRLADRFGTDHHELVVGPQDVALLDHVLSAFDEPFADASGLPTYLVSRLAREHVKVVLSGDGGDELFAGYERYRTDHRLRRLGRLGDLGLGGPLRSVSRVMPPGTPGKNFLYALSLPRMARYVEMISTFPPRMLAELLDPMVREAAGAPFERHLLASKGLDPLSRVQDLDIRTYLPGDILTKVDRMSMAHSLEARVPLLDHLVIEFACRLPARLRFRSGALKYLLKRAVHGKLPSEILTRPKHGFGVPLEAWFSNELGGFIRDRLGDLSRLAAAGLRPSFVRALMDRYHRQRRQDDCQRLWTLVVLDQALARWSERNAT